MENDPTEHEDLAGTRPADLARMLARLRQVQAGVFSPDRGDHDPAMCAKAITAYGGFLGPWLS